jgi:hypothetical protein
LGIFGFGPVDEPAAIDIASGFQLFFCAPEGFFLEDGLCDWCGQAAAFQISQRGAKNRVRRAETLQKARGQTGSEAGRERQGEPGEGGI